MTINANLDLDTDDSTAEAEFNSVISLSPFGRLVAKHINEVLGNVDRKTLTAKQLTKAESLAIDLARNEQRQSWPSSWRK